MRLAIVSMLLLSGCVGPGVPYVRSEAPLASSPIIRKAIEQTFADAKLPGIPMVSEIQEANPVSPGDWLVCVRSSDPARTETYSLYFKGDTLVKSQRSAMVDRCEDTTYQTRLSDAQPSRHR
jgi:hypothetical protein